MTYAKGETRKMKILKSFNLSRVVIIVGLIFSMFFCLYNLALALDDYSSAEPPPLYEQSFSELTEFQMKALQDTTESSGDILLIRSALPWNSNADTVVLDQLSYTYDITDMSNIPNISLDNYQVILIVNDQNQAFYDYYAANYNSFENFVQNGGVLVFFAADMGWAIGNNYTDLPGGIEVGDRYNRRNIIVDNSHPIITQELTNNPNGPLTNSDMDGTYTSHNFFIETTLPNGSDIILRTDDADQYPTLVIYPLGNGSVIASGLTWEYTYDRYSGPNQRYGFGRALPDVFKYAFILAGSHQRTGINLMNIYPEDNWEVSARPTRPRRPRVYKHPGDLVDIVAVITNTTGEQQQGVNLKVEVQPANAFDADFLRVFKRASAEEIAKTDPEEITNNISNTTSGDKRIITITNLTIPTENQQKWNDFVFRLRLKKTVAENTDIQAKATVYGNDIVSNSKNLSDFKESPLKVIKNGKIFLTNRIAMYKKFAKVNANNIDATDIHQLWNIMYRIVESKQGIIYYVDKYDRHDDDASDNPTLTWFDDDKREDYLRLHYDDDNDTNKEEGEINKVANLVDSMLKKFIDASGYVGSGRYVVIIGDDAIIPFYRVWDPTKTVLKYTLKTKHQR